MALLSSVLGSAGTVLQKKGSGWMVRSEKRPDNAKALFLIWAAGMVVAYAFSAVPLVIASKKLAPHIISSLSGFNIALTVVLSHFFLKEKLFRSDIHYGLVIAGSIALLSFHLTDTSGEVNRTYLYSLLAAPLTLLIPLLFKKMDKKRRVAMLGVFSGLMMGLSVVMLNILVKQNQTISAQIFVSPFLYFYLLTGAASVGAAQSAFRIGDIVLFTPVQVVAGMCYPLFCSFFLYETAVEWFQVVLILLMAFSCWGIERKR
ncbi:MAG TPA: hypothetical protein PK854_02280 [Oscillospiraceae bacterium]|nr:hypothetical protein [Oscillospiraceae bacterium]HPS34072.1 hypothetical protein [Oscillospiraceae bacterium]